MSLLSMGLDSLDTAARSEAVTFVNFPLVPFWTPWGSLINFGNAQRCSLECVFCKPYAPVRVVYHKCSSCVKGGYFVD